MHSIRLSFVQAFFLRLGFTIPATALSSGAADSPAAGVGVDVKPVEIVRRVFDPANPPPELPRLTPPEAACCEYAFGCEIAVASEGLKGLLKSPPARISSVRLTARLQVTIWVPTNGTPRLVEHEEGHRRICEHYYRIAPGVLSRLGAIVLATPLHASIKEAAKLRDETDTAQKKLLADFMAEVEQRCRFAQDRFDALTKHGTAALDEASAISQALAEETRAHNAARDGH